MCAWTSHGVRVGRQELSGSQRGWLRSPVVGGQAEHHEQALARPRGDTRRYPADTVKRAVIPPSHRVTTLGKRRSEHARTGAGQR